MSVPPLPLAQVEVSVKLSVDGRLALWWLPCAVVYSECCWVPLLLASVVGQQQA